MKTNWKRNIKIFTITTFFQWFYIPIGVWVLVWRNYLSWEEIAMVTGIGLACQLLLELPSGAMADMIGRKKTVLFGRFLGIIGFTLFIFADNFLLFAIANCLYLANWAFESGALTALLYDSLKENGQENEHYQKTEANGFFYATIGMAVASIIGGVLYGINANLPYLLTTVAAILAFITSLFLEEPLVEKTKFSAKAYLKQNWEGVIHIFRSPLIRSISFFSISIDFVLYVGLWYLYEPRLTEAGFKPEYLGLLVAGTYVVRAIGTKMLPLFLKLKDTQIPIVLTLIQIVGSLLSFIENKFGSVSSVYLRKFGDGFRYPILSKLQNDEIESKYRATSLSAMSMFTNVLIASVGPLIGYSISTFSVAKTLGAMGIVGIVIVLPAAIIVSRQIKFKNKRDYEK